MRATQVINAINNIYKLIIVELIGLFAVFLN